MVYEKKRIRRLIDFKDTIKDKQVQADMEWLITNYNDRFVELKENEKNNKEKNKLIKKYYDLEEERVEFLHKIKILTNRCLKYRKMCRILLKKCKTVEKKLDI